MESVYRYVIDGKEFKTLKEAEKYMRATLYNELYEEIKSVESTLDFMKEKRQTWYYCHNIDHLNAVIGSYNGYNVPDLEKFVFPDWFYVYIEYSGSLGNDIGIVCKTDFESDLNRNIKLLQNLEQNFVNSNGIQILESFDLSI